MEPQKNTTREIIASQNQDYVDEGLAEYQDQIQKLQCKFLTARRVRNFKGFLVLRINFNAILEVSCHNKNISLYFKDI